MYLHILSMMFFYADVCFVCLYASQQPRRIDRRLICSVATEPLPKEVEESKMEAPKEIFLKDYKQPDYYFDTVYPLILLLSRWRFGFSSSFVSKSNYYFSWIWNSHWVRKVLLSLPKLLSTPELKVHLVTPSDFLIFICNSFREKNKTESSTAHFFLSHFAGLIY